MTVYVNDGQRKKIDAQRKDTDRRMDEGSLPVGYVIDGQQQLLEQALAVEPGYGHQRHVSKYFRIGRSFTPEATIEAILQQVAQWIEQGRFPGLTSEHLAHLGPAPAWPTDKLTCVVPRIVVRGGPHANVASHLRLLQQTQPSFNYWKKVYDDPDCIRLLFGITLEPGISWATLDLSCHTKSRPIDVRSAGKSPTVEVLAAACLFKGWVDAMISGDAPNVNITGLILDVSGATPGREVPHLCVEKGHLKLTTLYDDGAYWRWACPELRK